MSLLTSYLNERREKYPIPGTSDGFKTAPANTLKASASRCSKTTRAARRRSSTRRSPMEHSNGLPIDARQ